ncbi:hypothetical protein E4U42_001062 [Claviceps africana]|uniref:Uncharacterized protein n=1 Tax=Claviceps africana TaxID=83212 RepID=A0A8K0JCE3_9HYPO|nr:hypothetical protein E4U42_001062 [Claviceps africana]
MSYYSSSPAYSVPELLTPQSITSSSPSQDGYELEFSGTPAGWEGRWWNDQICIPPQPAVYQACYQPFDYNPASVSPGSEAMYEHHGGNAFPHSAPTQDWSRECRFTTAQPAAQHDYDPPYSSCSSQASSIKREPISPVSSPSLSPGRPSALRVRGGRVNKPTPRSRKTSTRSSSKASRSEEWRDCYGNICLPTLKETCPSNIKLLWELKFEYTSSKGICMWDTIAVQYAVRTGSRAKTAAFEKIIEERKNGKKAGGECILKTEISKLQMRFRRGRNYILWHGKDEDTLRKALRETVGQTEVVFTWKAVLVAFLSDRGSANMHLNEEDVQNKFKRQNFLDSGEDAGLMEWCSSRTLSMRAWKKE